MSVMSTIDLSNNSVNGTGSRNDEGSSPGRCLMEEQRGPGRNPVTARMKWNMTINIAVMECYYFSNPMDENNKPAKGKGCIGYGMKGKFLNVVNNVCAIRQEQSERMNG